MPSVLVQVHNCGEAKALNRSPAWASRSRGRPLCQPQLPPAPAQGVDSGAPSTLQLLRVQTRSFVQKPGRQLLPPAGRHPGSWGLCPHTGGSWAPAAGVLRTGLASPSRHPPFLQPGRHRQQDSREASSRALLCAALSPRNLETPRSEPGTKWRSFVRHQQKLEKVGRRRGRGGRYDDVPRPGKWDDSQPVSLQVGAASPGSTGQPLSQMSIRAACHLHLLLVSVSATPGSIPADSEPRCPVFDLVCVLTTERRRMVLHCTATSVTR